MKDKGKLIRLPVTRERKKRNMFGPYYVPCMVSSRYMLFPNKSGGHFNEGEYIDLSIMTETDDGKSKKLCELIVTREDILRAINSIRESDNDRNK
jgi:hypothetical protein